MREREKVQPDSLPTEETTPLTENQQPRDTVPLDEDWSFPRRRFGPYLGHTLNRIRRLQARFR